MAWVLTKGMTNLRNQINRVGPNRDKASDGTVGDLAHQQGSSSHNPDRTGNPEWADGDALDEVRAIDIDNSGPWLPGVTAERLVQYLVQRGRDGHLPYIRYIIYNGRIWSASNGWVTQQYNGPSAHTEHIHFTGQFTQAADNDTTYNYGLESLVTEMPLTETDLDNIQIRVRAGVSDFIGDGNFAVANPTTAAQPQRFARDALRNIVGGPVDQAALLAAIASDEVDTQALAAALLPGLASAVSTNVVTALQPLINDGVVTASDIQLAAEAGLRNILGSLDN